ncbi:MAG: hypothetical protein V1772_10390 [Chloroflexota bacterium]
MVTLEHVANMVTPALVERVVRALVAARGADVHSGIAVEVIAHRILDEAGVARAAGERLAAVEALVPKIAPQVALIHGLRFIRND